jgi:hypothetical protein
VRRDQDLKRPDDLYGRGQSKRDEDWRLAAPISWLTWTPLPAINRTYNRAGETDALKTSGMDATSDGIAGETAGRTLAPRAQPSTASCPATTCRNPNAHAARKSSAK